MGTAVADSVTSAGMSTETFALAQVWAQIEAAPRPQPLQFPNLGDLVLQATPAPLPPGTPGKASETTTQPSSKRRKTQLVSGPTPDEAPWNVALPWLSE